MEITKNMQTVFNALKEFEPQEARDFAQIIRRNKDYSFVRRIMFGFVKKETSQKATTKATTKAPKEKTTEPQR